MSTRNWIQIVAIAAAVALPTSWSAAEEADEEKQPEAAQKEMKSVSSPPPQMLIAANMPMFVPPSRGAPPMRLGGATRGTHVDPEIPRIEALVPERVGLTLEEQPVLYWYLGTTTDVPLEFGLNRVDPVQQVVRTRLRAPAQAGVQRISLADHGVTLEPGALYFWFVKLVPNPDNHEEDRIVGGGIQRVSTPDPLASRLEDPTASQPHELAKAGIWYDAMDVYSTAIDSDPGDTKLREQRAHLMEQVDLVDIE